MDFDRYGSAELQAKQQASNRTNLGNDIYAGAATSPATPTFHGRLDDLNRGLSSMRDRLEQVLNRLRGHQLKDSPDRSAMRDGATVRPVPNLAQLIENVSGDAVCMSRLVEELESYI